MRKDISGLKDIVVDVHLAAMNTTSATKKTGTAPDAGLEDSNRLVEQYGLDMIRFAGPDGLYERHLLFDNIKDLTALGARERFEAAARSIRDVLSQRWVATEKAYDHENPKRVYYLSMEFLIGRSLSNNVTNLVLGPLTEHVAARKGSTGWSCSNKNPTRAWATAGWDAWQHVFWIPWPP